MTLLQGADMLHVTSEATSRDVKSWFEGELDWLTVKIPGHELTLRKEKDVDRVFLELRQNSELELLWRGTFFYGNEKLKFSTISKAPVKAKVAIDTCEAAVRGLYEAFEKENVS